MTPYQYLPSTFSERVVKKYRTLLLDNIVTNEIYKGVEHRPVLNPNKERLSIATFFKPKRDYYLSPASSLITPRNPVKFKQIGTVADYFKGYFSHQLVGKSYLDTMRLNTKDEEINT